MKKESAATIKSLVSPERNKGKRMDNHTGNYKKSGVNIEAGYETVSLIKEHVKRTRTKGVIGSIGSFSGMMEPDLAGIKNPVLVSATDGVGTKLKIAFLMDSHKTIGIDCVAMCVNDIICCGAKPLFFLDYLATGKVQPEKMAAVVSGVAEGCLQANCALLGGETAEMPGFYRASEYDIAGFSVGIVDKDKIIDGKNIKPGDIIIGLPSSGAHSNGFSLIRQIFDMKKLNDRIPELGMSLGEALLTPTKIYVKPVLSLIEHINKASLKGISHITGGGFYENIPRVLPENCSARIFTDKLPYSPIFGLIEKCGGIPANEMFNVFNMGIGMSLIVEASSFPKAVGILKKEGQQAIAIGEIVSGSKEVVLC